MELSNLTTLLLIILAGVILYYINTSKSSDPVGEESDLLNDVDQNLEEFENNINQEQEKDTQENVVQGAPEKITPDYAKSGTSEDSQNQYPNDCFPKDQLTPAELLPGDGNSKWAQVNPAGQGELGDQNFLNAGYHVGVNTVGQTLRNANLQLRSEPPNPQLKVSPWLQSTIEPDSNRKPLEIGGC